MDKFGKTNSWSAPRQSAWSFGAALLFLTLLGGSMAGISEVPTAADRSAAAIPETEFEGRVVCLPERMHELYQTELPAGHEHVFGFETNDGVLYTLLRTKFSEALFADERVRQKRLRLKGTRVPSQPDFRSDPDALGPGRSGLRSLLLLQRVRDRNDLSRSLRLLPGDS